MWVGYARENSIKLIASPFNALRFGFISYRLYLSINKFFNMISFRKSPLGSHEVCIHIQVAKKLGTDSFRALYLLISV